MNNFLRLLLCIVAGVSGLAAAAQYLAVIPPGTIPDTWIRQAMAASLIMLAVKEGIIVIGDILDDGVRNGSFNIEKLSAKETIAERAAKSDSKLTRVLVALLFAGMVSLMLGSCTTEARREAGAVLSASGQRVLQAATLAAEAAALEEIRRVERKHTLAGKQPLEVRP